MPTGAVFRPFSLRVGEHLLFPECGALYIAILADIQIQTTILRTIYISFFTSLPSLEQSPFGRRTGGRGKQLGKKLTAWEEAEYQHKSQGVQAFLFRFSPGS